MTREQIRSMQPGRELDALVAEKVMEYKNIRFGRNDTNAVWIGEERKFQPSTKISAAWEVVEKFGNQFAVRRTEEGYIAHVITNETEEAITCKTAPEAICKAALLAVKEVSA